MSDKIIYLSDYRDKAAILIDDEPTIPTCNVCCFVIETDCPRTTCPHRKVQEKKQ